MDKPRSLMYLAACFTVAVLSGCDFGGSSPPETPTNTGPAVTIPSTDPATTTTRTAGPSRRTAPPPPGPDTFVVLPPSVTLAAGGRPVLLHDEQNPLAPHLLHQLGPISEVVARAGLSLNQVDTFWLGANPERTEQILCLVLNQPLAVASIEEALKVSGNVNVEGYRIYLLPVSDGAVYGFCSIHSRVILLGRQTTLEQALRKPAEGGVRTALSALNDINRQSDFFWTAADGQALEPALRSGLPGIGTLLKPEQLTGVEGLAVGMQLEQATRGASSTSTGGEGLPSRNFSQAAGVVVSVLLSFDAEVAAQRVQPQIESALTTLATEKNNPPAPPRLPAGVGPSRPTGAPGTSSAPGASSVSVDPSAGSGAPGVSPTGDTASVDPTADPNSNPPDLRGGSGANGSQTTTVSSTASSWRSLGLRKFPGTATGNTNVGNSADTGTWTERDGANLRINYRFELWSPEITLVNDLFRAAGTTATGDGLFVGSLAILDRAARGWRQAHPEPQPGISHVTEDGVVAGYSWMTQLLPYMGYQQIYDGIDFTKSWADPANLPVTRQLIPEFLNPADLRTEWVGYPFNGMGLTHFAGMSGVEDRRNVVAATLPRTDPRAGIFGYDRIARPEEITDGESQTIMLIGTGRLSSPWVQGGGATIRGAREPYFNQLSGFSSAGLAQPGTFVMFADGSSRMISADIDPAVFRAMCTMHGAEQVDLSRINQP